MWPYFIPVMVCCFFCLIGTTRIVIGGYKKFIINTWAIMLIILVIFSGIRGNGSGDYFTYLDRGREIQSLRDIFYNEIHMDTGYCFLSWLINMLHFPAQAVIVGMNIISISCIGIFVKRYSRVPVLSILIFLPFFFQFDMHAARTASAIGILTLATPYVLERKFLKFILVLSIAYLFHAEALIGIILYFLPMIKIDLKIGLLLLGVGTLFAVPNLTDRICLFILEKLRLQSIYQRFLGYTNESRYFSYATKLYDPRFFLFLAIFLIACIYLKNDKGIFSRLLINTSFVTIFLMIFFSNHAFMCFRLSSFMGIYSLITIPMIITRHGECTTNMRKQSGNFRLFVYSAKYTFSVAIFFVLSIAYAYELGSTVPYKVFELIYW